MNVAMVVLAAPLAVSVATVLIGTIGGLLSIGFGFWVGYSLASWLVRLVGLRVVDIGNERDTGFRVGTLRVTKQTERRSFGGLIADLFGVIGAVLGPTAFFYTAFSLGWLPAPPGFR